MYAAVAIFSWDTIFHWLNVHDTASTCPELQKCFLCNLYSALNKL
jgi:hypothetical protein